MLNIFKRIFDIRDGEKLRAFSMFAYIFLVIASLLILKPLRNSIFLTKLGIEQLPYVFVFVAISAMAFPAIFYWYSGDILVFPHLSIPVGMVFISLFYLGSHIWSSGNLTILVVGKLCVQFQRG
jgi:AAA family ATP:ADP antiporter